VRHGRSAKQRLWLGPDRHCGSCGHAITDGNAESYAHSNSYAFGMRSNVTHTNAYCNCHGDSHADGYSKLDTEADANTQSCTEPETSPNTCSTPVARLATNHRVIGAFCRLARLHPPYHKRERAPIWKEGHSFDADFLKIVLTRFCAFKYKGVPLLEPREINHTGRNPVATPYSVSTTAPLSPTLIQ